MPVIFCEDFIMTDEEIHYALDTLAIRGGQKRTAELEHSEPIFPTSSYVFESAAKAAARFSGEEPGNIYSRFTNPTVRTFEERLALMEEGERCVATSSGMAAIMATCYSLLQQGDHIVSSNAIFGTSVVLFNNYIAKFGVDVSFVPLTDYDAWENAITEKTRFLFLETPSNPLTEIVDIQRLSEIAKRKNCLLIVDNCFCTPALQKPLNLGADIVIHSATKFLDGQGRCIGGAVVGSEEVVGKDIYGFLRTAGPTMSPFNAWVFLKGLETLNIRMQAHSENALKLAEWLQSRDEVEKVNHPGLKSHPQHELARQQQSHYGGVLSFVVKGGKEAAWALIDGTRMLSITANLGDAKTTITHPATTTHGRLSDEQKQIAGIQDGLIRIAVGLENSNDIINDVELGFKNIK